MSPERRRNAEGTLQVCRGPSTSSLADLCGPIKEALRDCAESLSPVVTAPDLSTYWIDRILAALSHEATAPVIARGNAWSLVRDRDEVKATFDYAEDGDEAEAISVDELSDGLTAYRDADFQAFLAEHT